MKVILLGPPGAGKGTQAERLVDYLKGYHLSTGEIFRENIKNETELGLKANSYINKGELVPDELTVDLVWDRLGKIDKGLDIVLDGFPRNLFQAEALDKGLEENNDKIDLVLYIDVPDQDLIDRISGRRVCPTCNKNYHVKSNPPKVEGICDLDGSKLIQRKDDTESTVKNRIDVYNRSTAVLIDYYTQKGNLVKVDGTKLPDEVFDQIKNSL